MTLTQLISTIPGRVREFITPLSQKEKLKLELRQIIEKLEINQVVSDWINKSAPSFADKYGELGERIREEFQIYGGVYVKVDGTIYYIHKGDKLKLDTTVIKEAERPPYDLTVEPVETLH